MNQNSTLTQKNENILFVSDLPRETNEDDLYDFFKNYHMTSSKVQRSKVSTFAHVFFENSDYAQKARKDLNGEILVPKYSEKKLGKPVRICKFEAKSQIMENMKDSSKSLLVKNLDKNISAKEFNKIFEEFGEVKSCKLEVDESGVSKGYGYVYYNEVKSAELAKQKLNGADLQGQKVEIVNLIPSKSKDNTRNNIYVKNIPRIFSDEDLWKLFAKYGEISSAVVSRDDKGLGKGFGFVCFANPLNAVQACKELKEKNLSFQGLPPLYVNFAMKKEDRIASYGKREEIQDPSNTKFIAVLTDVTSYALSDYELENEIRLFIKVVLLQEYSPKKIEINPMNRTAVVTMNSSKDLAELMKKYPESYNISTMKFMPVPFLEQPTLLENANPNEQYMGFPLVGMFQNMSLYNKPVQNFVPQMTPIPMGYQIPQMPNSGYNNNYQSKYGGYPRNQNQNYRNNYQNQQSQYQQSQNQQSQYQQVQNQNQNYNRNTGNSNNKGNVDLSNNYFNTKRTSQKNENEDPLQVEEVGAQIYEMVEKLYPDDAGKITGMIIDLGLEEMQILISQAEKLNKVIEEAHEMLHSNN